MYTYCGKRAGHATAYAGLGTVVHMTNAEFFAQPEETLIRFYMGPRGGKVLTREEAIAELARQRTHWESMRAQMDIANAERAAAVAAEEARALSADIQPLRPTIVPTTTVPPAAPARPPSPLVLAAAAIGALMLLKGMR